MGPATMQRYRDRGLTHRESHIAIYDSMFYNVGDTYTTEHITEQYSTGRIDVSNGEEIYVPPMRAVDWARLSLWFYDFQTMSQWSLEDIITAYNFWSGHEPVQWDTYEPTT